MYVGVSNGICLKSAGQFQIPYKIHPRNDFLKLKVHIL